MQFILNDKLIKTDQLTGYVTLDYIREIAGLKGTKEVCREGDCGACTVLLGSRADKGTVLYQAVCSCLLPLGDVAGKHLVTIEGLKQKSLNPIQQLFVDEQATQCGFCTPGFIISLTGLLLSSPNLDQEVMLDSIAGNICRCTGYIAILRVIDHLLNRFKEKLVPLPDRLSFLISMEIVPAYFKDISGRLDKIREQKTVPTASRTKIMGGGTDLYVQQADKLKKLQVESVFAQKELSSIQVKNGDLYLGGAVVTEAFRSNQRLAGELPQLVKFIPLIASKLIRNRATIAGNIVNASPIGDLTIMLLSLNAELELELEGVKRTLPLKKFYQGYKKFDLQEGELIKWIRIPKGFKTCLFNFEKVSKRNHLDIATVNSSIALKMAGDSIESAAIAAGGVAAFPLYLTKTATFLSAKQLSAELVRKAAEQAVGEIAPITDVRGSKEYKKLLLRQLLYAHFITLFPDKRLEEELL